MGAPRDSGSEVSSSGVFRCNAGAAQGSSGNGHPLSRVLELSGSGHAAACLESLKTGGGSTVLDDGAATADMFLLRDSDRLNLRVLLLSDPDGDISEERDDIVPLRLIATDDFLKRPLKDPLRVLRAVVRSANVDNELSLE